MIKKIQNMKKWALVAMCIEAATGIVVALWY